MKYSKLLLGAIFCVMPMAAAAQPMVGDHPAYAPTKDVVVTYEMKGSERHSAATVRISYADHGQLVRLDLYHARQSAPFGSIIFNSVDRRVFTLLPTRHAYLQRDTAGLANPGLLLNSTMSFKHIGLETVANMACTEWKVSGAAGTGTACVSHDGIILKATRNIDGKPGAIEAERVTYGPLPASLFVPPKHWRDATARHAQN